MKTKVFFTACLLLCMAMIQLPAQNAKNGNGSVPSIVFVGIYIPVFKDNVLIDYLYADYIAWQGVSHYVNGEPAKMSMHTSGELTGLISGEVFKFVEQDRSKEWTWVESIGIYYWNIQTAFDNLRGNQGTHYILRYTFDMNNYLSGGSGIIDYRIIFAGKK